MATRTRRARAPWIAIGMGLLTVAALVVDAFRRGDRETTLFWLTLSWSTFVATIIGLYCLAAYREHR